MQFSSTKYETSFTTTDAGKYTGLHFSARGMIAVECFLLYNVSWCFQICTLYEYLMDKHFLELSPQYEDVWVLQWVKIIFPMLKDPQPPATSAYYQRLLISAFKVNISILSMM